MLQFLKRVMYFSLEIPNLVVNVVNILWLDGLRTCQGCGEILSLYLFKVEITKGVLKRSVKVSQAIILS